MKVLLLITCLACLRSQAQDIPKRANLIKVKPVSFRSVANTLLDAGYTFKAIDSNYNTITTNPKHYSRKVGGIVQFNIRVKDSTATITGYCGLYESDFSTNPGRGLAEGKSEIENRGMKGSLMKESFEVMDRVAHSLGGRISYIKL